MKERGPPLGSGPHLGEASRSGSKQFPLQRPHQGKHQLSARAGGGVGEGGRGFNFDNRAFKCFHQCCPTCSMWKLCRSLVLWNNKHEHKAWSMKCNHLWQMYTGGKTNCIHTKMLWSSGKCQARIGKGWPSKWKASKLKPLPRAYIKVGCHHLWPDGAQVGWWRKGEVCRVTIAYRLP